MPWLPLVGSTMIVRPGSMRPSASAASIMFRAVRVLIDPPTLRPSILTRTSALPGFGMRVRRMSGVLPTASRMLL